MVYAEPDTGLMITETVPGIATMTPELFNARVGSPTRAGAALAKLHNSGETF